MKSKIDKFIKNRKGNSMVGYVIIYPILLYFLLYIVFAGSFFIQSNEMRHIANAHFDRFLVEGRFEPDRISEMTEQLEAKNFRNLNISSSHPFGSNINRGELMFLEIRNETPHAFYYLNRYVLLWTSPRELEETFKIKVRLTGMSEKWHN